MEPAPPILVTDLFPEILDALLALLGGLTPAQWAAPTACASWSVHDVALHLLGDDASILARQRDGFTPPGAPPGPTWEELVAWLNARNARWVEETRRISPPLLCDLLRLTGTQASAHFAGRDLYALGAPVSWAGPGPAPVWMDVAREYTERWHHQQHIRDAVGQPGLMEPRYFAPVLDAFVRALPHAYRAVPADPGTLVQLTIAGAAGGTWVLRNDPGGWQLYRDADRPAHAGVVIPQDVAWRLFTKGLSPAEAEQEATLTGDPALGRQALAMVSIIA